MPVLGGLVSAGPLDVDGAAYGLFMWVPKLSGAITVAYTFAYTPATTTNNPNQQKTSQHSCIVLPCNSRTTGIEPSGSR